MAYLDPRSRFTIATRVRRLFGDPDTDATSPTWQERVYRDVGKFLSEHRLDPTPDNYDLAFQYRAAFNTRLVSAIREAIDVAGTLTAEAAERIFAEVAAPLGADSLTAFAQAIETQAHGLTRIADQSGRDASAFRTAIAAKSAEDDPAAILELTTAMVARTRAAEAQLRRAQNELTGLRSTLVEAQRIADVDPLTELPNRRAFKRDLDAAIATAKAGGSPLAVAFCDIDHFKRVNDAHGHETGDRVLRFIAAMLAKAFAHGGSVGRFGGEEFVVMIPAALGRARDAVDACRADLAARHLYAATDGASIGTVTFSAGVTALTSGDGTADLLRRADDALYRAKHDGRDRVVVG